MGPPVDFYNASVSPVSLPSQPLVQMTVETHQKGQNQRNSVMHTIPKDHLNSSTASLGYRIMGVLKEWRRN